MVDQSMFTDHMPHTYMRRLDALTYPMPVAQRNADVNHDQNSRVMSPAVGSMADDPHSARAHSVAEASAQEASRALHSVAASAHAQNADGGVHSHSHNGLGSVAAVMSQPPVVVHESIRMEQRQPSPVDPLVPVGSAQPEYGTSR